MEQLLIPGGAARAPRAGPVCLALALLAALATAPLGAQLPVERRFFVEGRGGAVVPTFDIADVVEVGPSFGATLGYQLAPNWVLMGEFDFGRHEDDLTGEVDINTLHYMGKVGYSFTGPRDRGWEALVNLGAGAVTFDVEEGETNTYFAVNAGGKVAYHFTPAVAVVVSPQGDIAFSDEDELTTDNSWVWPVTAGVRLRF
ncbi:MAG TPA: outer membrane beta-barrel protein [Gemmatimonadales bacterium]|nr:outer membrane beta-barrel protein [Gemmatimonadales bacterium]